MSSVVAGFPPQTVYFITNVSQAKPGIVTLATVTRSGAFPVALGQTVTISKVVGMFQLNDNRYIVGGFDSVAKTFMLYNLSFHPVDTSSFNAYESGGEINIISFPATATNPPGLMYNNEPT